MGITVHVLAWAPARAPSQPGRPTGPAVCSALLRVYGVAGPDPGPGLAPGLRPCRACSRAPPRAGHGPVGPGPGPPPPSRVPHAGHSGWVPALPRDALRPSGSAASGSAASGFAAFEDLCALVTADSLNAAIAGAVGSARCLTPFSIGSAVAVGLCSVSRPSNPPSFRRFPAPRRRPRAAGVSGPAAIIIRVGRTAVGAAEPKLFGSGKDGVQ